jgi:Phage integrase family
MVATSDQELLDGMMDLAMRSRAMSTLGTYGPPWQKFVTWCQSRSPSYEPLPADPVIVAMYLYEVYTQVLAANNTYAVIKSASAAIFCMHSLAGVQTSPTKHVMVKSVRQAAKRELGNRVRNRKEPLPFEVCSKMVEILAYCGAPIWSVMLAAMVSLSYVAFLRYNDFSGILVKDFYMHEEGHATVFLEKRKNDQFREGSVIYIAHGCTLACPITLVRRLISEGNLAPDAFLFQSFDGGMAYRQPMQCKLDATPITYKKAHYQILKYIAKALGISQAEATIMFGTHSLRSGGASHVASENVDERLFQAHGGWKSKAAMHAYIKESLQNKLSVSAAIPY